MVQELDLNQMLAEAQSYRSSLGGEHTGRYRSSALRFRDADYQWMDIQYHCNAVTLLNIWKHMLLFSEERRYHGLLLVKEEKAASASASGEHLRAPMKSVLVRTGCDTSISLHTVC